MLVDVIREKIPTRMGKESGGMRALMRDYGCSVGAWFFSSFVIFVSTTKEFF